MRDIDIVRKHLQIYRDGEIGVGDTVMNAVKEAMDSSRAEIDRLKIELSDQDNGLIRQIKIRDKQIKQLQDEINKLNGFFKGSED